MRPPNQQSSPMRSGNSSKDMQTFVPIDDQTPPSLWRLLILVLVGYAFLSSMWVFSEMPGTLSVSGEPAWSSDQTWYAASHFCSLAVAALLVWLKR